MVSQVVRNLGGIGSRKQEARVGVSAVHEDVGLGEGIYTFPEAARIVLRDGGPYSSRRLRSWMKKGLTYGEHPTSADVPVLSFSDLVSLEIVRRLRAEGLSLQKVRRIEERLRTWEPRLTRPFAHDVLFTDGVCVWAALHPESDDAIEVIGDHYGHSVWKAAIKSFATEIRFQPSGLRRAVSWELTPWVIVDPEIQFGTPVVAGTRIPVRTIKANLEVGTPQQVADWYGLTVEQVEGARAFPSA